MVEIERETLKIQKKYGRSHSGTLGLQDFFFVKNFKRLIAYNIHYFLNTILKEPRCVVNALFLKYLDFASIQMIINRFWPLTDKYRLLFLMKHSMTRSPKYSGLNFVFQFFPSSKKSFGNQMNFQNIQFTYQHWVLVQGVSITTVFFQRHTTPTKIVRFQKFLHWQVDNELTFYVGIICGNMIWFTWW